MKLNQTNDKTSKPIYEVPIWKRLTLPENLFPEIKGEVIEQISVDGNGVEIEPYEAYHEALFKDSNFTKHLGLVFGEYISNEKNHGYVVKSNSRDWQSPVVKISYHMSDDRPVLVDNQLIVVEEGSKLTVVLDYLADDNVENSRQHYGTTRVIAKRGSFVKVIKLQRLGDADAHFDQNFSIVEEGAKLELVDVQFGAQTKAVAYESQLLGRHANADLQSLYFGDKNEQLDLSFTMRHFGAKSESHILSKGALSGNSKKVFRGNLFFETGSVQSVGKEKEVVVLLNDKIKSDSIPALLCSEDDVIGEHAASIGQLDHEKLFYLMSRGLSLEAAKRLVIKASFEEVLMTIGDDGLKSSIEEALDRRLSDGRAANEAREL
ncbi:Fe-S cluster assembly protein SufD [Fusibacter bizertensis]|uniref:Fe-S cluster assembly protein SufD n=1 Tax=Fusibacter bizertensis TaxID=1488331 RepID=A0ABT6NCC0_9FIRM|nr:Fe-S cluster assembly protein SufD [Fusibacter bizertensis]MDH8678042.1 Fe-S cluster assembly protein SufD [Fusibacter bizertensis]